MARYRKERLTPLGRQLSGLLKSPNQTFQPGSRAQPGQGLLAVHGAGTAHD